MSRVLLKPIDTGSVKLDVYDTYGVGKPTWRDFNLNDGKSVTDRQNRVSLTNYGYMITQPGAQNEDDRVTLIDTGISTTRDPVFTQGISGTKNNQLSKSVPLKSVDRVILTSLHYLRAGHLVVHNTRGDAEPVCPNADYVTPKSEWDAAMGYDQFHREMYPGVRVNLKMLEKLATPVKLVDEREVDLGFGISMEISRGVTIANATVYVALGSEKVMISPLLFPTPFHLYPSVQFGFGMSRFEAYNEKMRLLEKAEQERLCIVLPMDPQQRAYYIERDRTGTLAPVPCDILEQHRIESQLAFAK